MNEPQNEPSFQERHEPKHAEVHVEIGDKSEGLTDSFAIPAEQRRDHIPEPEHPADGHGVEPPQVAGSGPMSKVPGENNASDTPHADVS